MQLDPTYAERRARLFELLRPLEGLAVAFSGGVDSSVLLHAVHTVLGERAVGLIADSPSLPRRELRAAHATARAIGARFEVLATREGEDERYRANAGDRCYFCKTALFEAMAAWAAGRGLAALAFGEIVDDALDDRPGARAAREFRVLAPLAEAGFGKADVRRYAREAGLSVWDRPASACLASRIPVGTRVSAERLARVEAAEDAVLRLGLRQVRVRDHGRGARLEVGADELPRARRLAAEIAAALGEAGFARYELAAYRAPAQRLATRETEG